MPGDPFVHTYLGILPGFKIFNNPEKEKDKSFQRP
jgi:hypothetical protein